MATLCIAYLCHLKMHAKESIECPLSSVISSCIHAQNEGIEVNISHSDSLWPVRRLSAVAVSDSAYGRVPRLWKIILRCRARPASALLGTKFSQKFEKRKRSAEKDERIGSACRILVFRKSYQIAAFISQQ